MSDSPETPELEPEQRLPATRPPAEPAPVERFTARPSVHARTSCSPERAAQIVRQSSNARWVGFLDRHRRDPVRAVYWFYELGGPLGIPSPPRRRADAQQVTAVERGYNVFEANCARCHGVNGEGGIGPDPQPPGQALRAPQRELPAERARAGGRYVCGDAELADAGLVEPGHPARAAQLPPDRRPDRVPAGDERRRPTRSATRARRAREGPADRQGGDVHGLARPELQAGPGRHAVSRPAGRRVRDAVSLAGASGSPAPRRAERIRRARRVAVGRAVGDAAAAGAPGLDRGLGHRVHDARA